MNQKALYEPTKAWLENRGFRVLVAGDRTKFVIPISDLFPAAYKVPDLVGVNAKDQVVIAEVETDKERFFEAFGRCLLWRCLATFAYLTYPKGKIQRAPFMSRLGVGLLEVDAEARAVNELITLPDDGRELSEVWELHPTDFKREQELALLIRDTLERGA